MGSCGLAARAWIALLASVVALAACDGGRPTQIGADSTQEEEEEESRGGSGGDRSTSVSGGRTSATTTTVQPTPSGGSGGRGGSSSGGTGGAGGSSSGVGGMDASTPPVAGSGATGGADTDAGVGGDGAGGATTEYFSLVDATPLPDETDVETTTDIVLTFNRTLAGPATSSDVSVTAVNGLAGDRQPVRSFSTKGNVITITLDDPLEPDELYEVSVRSSLRDEDGDWLSRDVLPIEYTFRTAPHDDQIDIGSRLRRIVYDAASHTAYGIDAVNRELVTIDLGTRGVSRDDLLYNPSDLCLDVASDRVFVVAIGSSFVSEYVLSTRAHVRDVAWPAPSWSGLDAGEGHYHVRCAGTRLYLVDADWSPGLWTVDLSETDPVATEVTEVSAVGDLVFTSDGSFYVLSQTSWLTAYGATVFRVEVDTWTELDRTNTGSSTSNLLHDAPVLLDESLGIVGARHYLFDADNLLATLFTFDPGEVMLASDEPRSRFAGKFHVYDVTTYRSIAGSASSRASNAFFDKDGKLYLMVDPKSALYVQTF